MTEHPDVIAEDRMRNADAALRNLERKARVHEAAKPWEGFIEAIVPTYDTPFTTALEDRGNTLLRAEATRRYFCEYLEMLDDIGDPRQAFAAFDLSVQNEINRLARIGMNSTSPVALAIAQAKAGAAAELLDDLKHTRHSLAEERRALDEANTAADRHMAEIKAGRSPL